MPTLRVEKLRLTKVNLPQVTQSAGDSQIQAQAFWAPKALHRRQTSSSAQEQTLPSSQY